MLILEAALTAILALHGATVKAPSRRIQPVILALNDSELARAIKSNLESISGTGTVDVSSDNGTRFSARIAISGFNSTLSSQIHDRELGLHQLFPDIDFDFYFGGPELARAIKADLESISGRDTVDVTVDSRTLVTVRVETPALSSETYRRIFDRELEFYRAFPDLNFDFYVRSGPAGPVASK